MALSDDDLAWIRDEVGDTTPPTDGDLDDLYDTLGHRTLVALRVLKRRRASLAGGSTVDSFTLTGVFSVSQKADLKALDTQIARLEGAYAAESGVPDLDSGVTTGRLQRFDTGR